MENNLKAYIESGVLELYVLGELSAEERLEVEQMCARHPEIKAELTGIEQALQVYSETFAINPPEQLKDKIVSEMLGEEISEPAIAPTVSKTPRLYNFYKYAFAACLALLVLSVVALIVLQKQLHESNTQLLALEASNQKFANRVNYINTQLENANQAISVLQNPEYQLIPLKGTSKAPEASMKVAFNPKSKTVLIDMASLKMPANDKEHQYQLWAIVDGKPVDLGVFDNSGDSLGMKKMKPIAGASAFAVTLEPHGGSKVPTLTEMVVMGEI